MSTWPFSENGNCWSVAWPRQMRETTHTRMRQQAREEPFLRLIAAYVHSCQAVSLTQKSRRVGSGKSGLLIQLILPVRFRWFFQESCVVGLTVVFFWLSCQIRENRRLTRSLKSIQLLVLWFLSFLRLPWVCASCRWQVLRRFCRSWARFLGSPLLFVVLWFWGE